MMLTKEECKQALENAMCSGIVKEDYHILEQLMDEYFDLKKAIERDDSLRKTYGMLPITKDDAISSYIKFRKLEEEESKRRDYWYDKHRSWWYSDDFLRLIRQHFDNTPLTFEQIKEGMWIWNVESGWVKVDGTNNGKGMLSGEYVYCRSYNQKGYVSVKYEYGKFYLKPTYDGYDKCMDTERKVLDRAIDIAIEEVCIDKDYPDYLAKENKKRIIKKARKEVQDV